jgi:EF hand
VTKLWQGLSLGAAVVLIGGGVWAVASTDRTPALPPPPANAGPAATSPDLPLAPPEADPQDREERRFARYDRDDNGGVTRGEYLASREKAFGKLDTNGDGRLSFEEYAVKTSAKFAKADADRSGVLAPAEFATTAVKRKSRVEKCPPAREEADG